MRKGEERRNKKEDNRKTTKTADGMIQRNAKWNENADSLDEQHKWSNNDSWLLFKPAQNVVCQPGLELNNRLMAEIYASA